MALGHLSRPPILEVVCGVLFEALPDLDPVRVGLFWAEHRERYAKHELHPPIRDGAGFELLQGIGPVRSWLLSPGEEYVLQLQPDRLYFNWRRRGDAYPRFNTYGDNPGVLDRMLAELDRVSAFVKAQGVALVPHTIELAKIDHIAFNGFDEMVALVPAFKGLQDLSRSAFPELSVVLKETVEGAVVRTALSTFVSPELVPALKCDIFAREPLAPGRNVRDAMRRINDVLNGSFERLVSEEALRKFGRRPSS